MLTYCVNTVRPTAPGKWINGQRPQKGMNKHQNMKSKIQTLHDSAFKRHG